jgi:hypothetical protein
MYTGYDVPPPALDSSRPTDPPSRGSVCSYLHSGGGPVPPYVFLPCPLGWGEFKHKPGQGAGFLGQRFEPLSTECIASVDNPPDQPGDMQVIHGEPVFGSLAFPPELTVDRFAGRRSLLSQLDGQLRDAEARPAVHGFNRQQQLAFDLLTSAEIRSAFDLRREPARLRERYGRSLFGSSTLLARRLIERGARFVNVSWDNFSNRFQVTKQVWDTHERNFPILRQSHLPNLDQTYSALMEDLDARGLLDETLVVLMGEMGRTPRINANGGRDHWTFCYSVLLAGAGIRGGTVYGESDAQAAYIRDRPAHIRDICATIYHCLGIDPEMTVYDHGRRPIAIAHGGRPLSEVVVG